MDAPDQFLVIGPQRSGTTVVFLMLRGHPRAAAISDEIDPAKLFGDGVLAFTRSRNVIRPDQQDAYLARIFAAVAGTEADAQTLACGMKAAVWDPGEAAMVVEKLRGPLAHVKTILTIRADLVAQFGSLKRAEATGQWHSWSKGTSMGSKKLELDPKEFENYAARVLKVVSALRSLHDRGNVLELGYERDILADPRATARKVFEFVGLPDVEPDWLQSEKVAPPPQEYVANYDRLERVARKLTGA